MRIWYHLAFKITNHTHTTHAKIQIIAKVRIMPTEPYNAKNKLTTGLANSSSEPRLKMVSDKQKQGDGYEQLACRFLQSQGLTLIGKNWLQPKVGEIDLIMLEQGKAWDTLVFVEVRARKSNVQGYNYGDAISSITKGKQAKLIRTAKHFLQAHPHYQNYECRFDVVGYNINSNINSVPQEMSEPEWIQGAFITMAW